MISVFLLIFKAPQISRYDLPLPHSSSRRKLGKGFFHLRPQALKPLPLLTLLDLSSAWGSINHTFLETLSLCACVRAKVLHQQIRLIVSCHLALSNCQTLRKLLNNCESLFLHLWRRDENHSFIGVVMKITSAACKVFAKEHVSMRWQKANVPHLPIVSPLLAPK